MKIAYNLDKVDFAYGTKKVLSIDKLEIPAGIVTAILGPNGSGKTTLLQILSFVEHPSSGSVKFFDEPCTRSNRLSFRRRIGYLTQKPYLFNTDVFENVAWALRLRGIGRKLIRKTCEQALAQVDLLGFEKRLARSLSGGEAQRVALARALAIDPDVFLFDEPTSHLDVKSHSLMNDIIKRLNKSQEKTIVVITHDYSDIKEYVPNFVEMMAGRVVRTTFDV
ncbi:MAG: ABC transporter ATP-binding protein [Syntrophaceae bacterium]|nr:ABC transporter ATP-binding protein [Syntrophaceae bacterium]